MTVTKPTFNMTRRSALLAAAAASLTPCMLAFPARGGEPDHGFSIFGKLKYPNDFKYFE